MAELGHNLIRITLIGSGVLLLLLTPLHLRAPRVPKRSLLTGAISLRLLLGACVWCVATFAIWYQWRSWDAASAQRRLAALRREAIEREAIERETATWPTAARRIFPIEQSWKVATFNAVSASPGTLQITIEDATHGDAVIMCGSMPLSGPRVDFVIAYRVSTTRRPQNVKGEIAIGLISGDSIRIVTRCSVANSALPSRKAVNSGWFDACSKSLECSDGLLAISDELESAHSNRWAESGDKGKSRKPFYDLRDRSPIHIVSWNGGDSTAIAEVKHPSYRGFFSIGTYMDTPTRARTTGLLPDWPEPVWFVRAKFVPTK